MDIEKFGLYELRSMRLEDVQKIFLLEFLQQLTFFNISGNHGDFVTCVDALPIVRYIRQNNNNLKIHIATNGSGQPKIWKSLGELKNIEVHFAIDGLKDTHHLYRQDTDWDLVIDNAKKFISSGGRAFWKMIEFDFNQHQREQAKILSRELGFAGFYTVNHGRDNFVVFDRVGNYRHTVGKPRPEIKDAKYLLETWLKGLDGVDFSQTYLNTPSDPIICRAQHEDINGDLKFTSIYVQSNGQVYPCCWTGAAPDTRKMTTGSDQIRALSLKNNAIEVGLEKAMEWFRDLENAWKIPEIIDGRPYICNNVCATKKYKFINKQI